MRILPESARRADWPRLVKDTVNAIVVAVRALQSAVAAIIAPNAYTGWETYTHGGGAQSLVAATRTEIEIDGGTDITSQKPTDVTSLWDAATDRIVGRDGDAILVKVQCTFTPDDGVASEVLFDVDIGGVPGIVERQRFSALNGAGNPHYLSWTFAAYTLDTWEANGGKLSATADGDGDITDLRIVITRTHKAR